MAQTLISFQSHTVPFHIRMKFLSQSNIAGTQCQTISQAFKVGTNYVANFDNYAWILLNKLKPRGLLVLQKPLSLVLFPPHHPFRTNFEWKCT